MNRIDSLFTRQSDSPDPYESPRAEMVEKQLRRKGIRDERVLAAFRKIPRHLLVNPEDRGCAYEDHPISIGFGQTISQPYIVACMTEHLALTGSEKVLEIGIGSGYQAAILAELAAHVYTVERLEALSETARRTLDVLGYRNVSYHVGDGSLGWPEHAPFDRIMVAAAAPAIPSSLIRQLADGGRMVIPVGDEKVQDLILVMREGQDVVQKKTCQCVFVKLVGKEGWT